MWFPPIVGLLLLTAFVCTILAVLQPPKCPLWVPVFILCVVELLKFGLKA